MKPEEAKGDVRGDREVVVGQVQPVAVNWKPPPSGYYKVNWDASLNHAKGKLGVEVIVRDTNEKIYATSSSSVQASMEPVVAESMAALQAVDFCRGRGLVKIVLEFDSLQVVNAIKK
jgi:ribonuclease HI